MIQGSQDDPRIKEWIDLNMRSWQSLAAQLLSFAGEVKTLADIGAGTGGFLQAVREVMPTTELYAVESSEHACNSMRKRLPGVKFPFPCAEDLATTDHKFDCITILQCLEHVCEPTTILEKAYSSLNEGGLILIAVPNRYSYEVFLKGKAKSLCYSNATHLHFFTKATMQQCLKRAGFGQIQRLAQFGNGEYTGWRAVAQYALRKVGLSTELRYIARKV